MKKIAKCFTVILLLAFSVLAQPSSGRKPGEVFIGYSNGQVQSDFETPGFLTDYASFNGFDASGVVNVTRYIGIKGDVSGTYQNKRYSFDTVGGPIAFTSKNSVYNFLGGVQFKDNLKKGVFKPFVHVLAGIGRAKVRLKDVSCPTGVDCSFIGGNASESGFAAAVGGGIDLRLNDKIQIRAVQFDYNPLRLDGETQHNFRLSAGIVF